MKIGLPPVVDTPKYNDAFGIPPMHAKALCTSKLTDKVFVNAKEPPRGLRKA